jgi:hypothetical protein
LTQYPKIRICHMVRYVTRPMAVSHDYCCQSLFPRVRPVKSRSYGPRARSQSRLIPHPHSIATRTFTIMAYTPSNHIQTSLARSTACTPSAPALGHHVCPPDPTMTDLQEHSSTAAVKTDSHQQLGPATRVDLPGKRRTISQTSADTIIVHRRPVTGQR